MANVKKYIICHGWKGMTSRTDGMQDYWLLERISIINVILCTCEMRHIDPREAII